MNDDYPILPGLDEAQARQYGFLGALNRLIDAHTQDTGAPPSPDEVNALALIAFGQHGGRSTNADDQSQGQQGGTTDGGSDGNGDGGPETAFDDPDCSEIRAQCHEQCCDESVGCGNKSDSFGLLRRCTRKCMEIHGCHEY
ncbi:MAG: hypothetical protein M0006_13740 [Magnetospirillum sp.]|nr:hypothetical protein [Magnetospirillum sp.]